MEEKKKLRQRTERRLLKLYKNHSVDYVKQAHFKVLGPRLGIVRSFPALYI